MNRIEIIRFLHDSLRVCRNREDGIEKVCINDLCRVMKRVSFIGDGTAIRKCPSASIEDESRPKEFYADFGEAIAFVKWIAAGSKVLSGTGRELLELLQHSRIAAHKPEPPPVETEPESAEVIMFEYSGNTFSMRMNDGRLMVNATEMARPFEKRPTVWLKLAETVKLRQALTADGICGDTEGQVLTARGPQGATWLEIHLWVQFAQWLSPAFASWCSKKLVTLLKGSSSKTPSSPDPTPRTRYEDFTTPDPACLPVPANYEEALTVIDRQQDTIRKQTEFLRQNRHKYQHYEETIETREWFSPTLIAGELGISVIKLNLFLADQGVQAKICGEWVIDYKYRHLRDIHIYEWFNHKTKYTNKYKIDGWTPAGREYIIELWKRNNG